jgi:glycosyltransferase involved in cell wall biosynthesis
MLGALDVKSVGIPHVGYGRMADSIRDALVDRVELRDDADGVVFCYPPDMVKGWWEGQRTAVLTMWETTLIPDRYTRTLRTFDKVLVPCDWNAELFDRFHDDISVVPLGIDVDFWRPQNTPDNERFRLVTGGSGWKRKGITQIIKAFRDADLPDAELLIKVTPHLIDDPKQYDFGPNIRVIKKTMTLDEERAFYASADCFISASRGEGFGMIPLQCRALGIPIIAPAHTGHLMFKNLIDFPLSWDYGHAEMQYFTDIGQWFVPNHDEMVDAIRTAYQLGRPTLFERQMRWEETEHWSWDNTADRLLAAFPAGGLMANKRWIPAGSQTVKVRTLCKVEADVGQFRLRFPADTVVDVPISTLRHLFECGLVTEI